jgi:hypothetical protein
MKDSSIFSNDELELLREIVGVQNKVEKRINVLDYALMNEDGHTYFLQSILQHERDNKQVFIKSFLSRILEEELLDENERYEIFSQVPIEIGEEKEKRRLDLLIKSDSKYIIIENKVKLATDGDRQMEQYWQYAVVNFEDKARLVYLTLAGGSPAKWSCKPDILEKLLNTGRYCEKNYRTDIVEWLKEDVLPNCLVSESYLSQSIRLYIDAISRLSGMYDKSDLAERVYEILKCYNVSSFDQVQERLQYLNEKLGKLETSNEHWVLLKEAINLIGVVRTWLLRECVYNSPSDTAYNLKWILKNNPTLDYKRYGTFNVSPFKSISQFTYQGGNYVQLATAKYDDIGTNLRIHIRCNEEGLKNGPYVFDEIVRHGFVSIDDMKAEGFEKVTNANFYRLPMPQFDKKSTELVEVARFVEKMIEKLCALASKNGRSL